MTPIEKARAGLPLTCEEQTALVELLDTFEAMTLNAVSERDATREEDDALIARLNRARVAVGLPEVHPR